MKIGLKYFDIPGRGEVLRILLSGCKNIEYTDTRIPFSEWRTVKPTLPYGQVPVLCMDDGAVMTQSTSLYRYCAKLVDLYPSDPFQALVVDETMDVVNDMLTNIPSQGTGTDEELKIKRHEYRDTILKQGLTLIESRIEQYGVDTNTICGIPSVADVCMMTVTNALKNSFFTHLDGTILTEYPLIMKVADTATRLPIVVSYNNKS